MLIWFVFIPGTDSWSTDKKTSCVNSLCDSHLHGRARWWHWEGNCFPQKVCLSTTSSFHDCVRPVFNHPPNDWVKSGYLHLCCIDCDTLTEVGLSLDVWALLTDIWIHVFPSFHSLLTMRQSASDLVETLPKTLRLSQSYQWITALDEPSYVCNVFTGLIWFFQHLCASCGTHKQKVYSSDHIVVITSVWKGSKP